MQIPKAAFIFLAVAFAAVKPPSVRQHTAKRQPTFFQKKQLQAQYRPNVKGPSPYFRPNSKETPVYQPIFKGSPLYRPNSKPIVSYRPKQIDAVPLYTPKKFQTSRNLQKGQVSYRPSLPGKHEPYGLVPQAVGKELSFRKPNSWEAGQQMPKGVQIPPPVVISKGAPVAPGHQGAGNNASAVRSSDPSVNNNLKEEKVRSGWSAVATLEQQLSADVARAAQAAAEAAKSAAKSAKLAERAIDIVTRSTTTSTTTPTVIKNKRKRATIKTTTTTTTPPMTTVPITTTTTTSDVQEISVIISGPPSDPLEELFRLPNKNPTQNSNETTEAEVAPTTDQEVIEATTPASLANSTEASATTVNPFSPYRLPGATGPSSGVISNDATTSASPSGVITAPAAVNATTVTATVAPSNASQPSAVITITTPASNSQMAPGASTSEAGSPVAPPTAAPPAIVIATATPPAIVIPVPTPPAVPVVTTTIAATEPAVTPQGDPAVTVPISPAVVTTAATSASQITEAAIPVATIADNTNVPTESASTTAKPNPQPNVVVPNFNIEIKLPETNCISPEPTAVVTISTPASAPETTLAIPVNTTPETTQGVIEVITAPVATAPITPAVTTVHASPAPLVPDQISSDSEEEIIRGVIPLIPALRPAPPVPPMMVPPGAEGVPGNIFVAINPNISLEREDSLRIQQ